MTLKEALINQGNTPDRAEEIIRDMKESIEEGCDPEDVLQDEGLEPDYVLDLLD